MAGCANLVEVAEVARYARQDFGLTVQMYSAIIARIEILEVRPAPRTIHGAFSRGIYMTVLCCSLLWNTVNGMSIYFRP